MKNNSKIAFNKAMPKLFMSHFSMAVMTMLEVRNHAYL